MLLLGFGSIAAERTPCNLNKDDGVIHHITHGHGQTTQGHDVNTQAKHGEQGHAQQHGERHTHQCNHGRAEVQEGKENHTHHHQGGNDESLFTVLQRQLNEVCLTVSISIQLHVGRQATFLKLLHRGIHRIGQLKRVGTGHFLHGEYHSLATGHLSGATITGIATAGRTVNFHLSHMLQTHHAICGVVCHNGTLEVFFRKGASVLLHGQLYTGHIFQIAGRDTALRGLYRVLQIRETDAGLAHLLRVIRNLVFRQAATQNGHLPHTGNGQQAVAQLKLCHTAHL